ncbi:MAG: hypothetical protein V2A73_06215 [Pseudomonadota bacterium]
MRLMRLKTKRTAMIGAIALGSLGIGACNPDEPDPASTKKAATPETAQELAATVAIVFDEIAKTGATFQGSEMLNTLARSVPIAVTVEEEATIDGMKRLGKRLAMKESAEEESDGEVFAKMLKEKLFTEKNYEGDGVYLVPAEFVCEPGDSDYAACAQSFGKAELRVRAVVAGEGLDLTILVGTKRIDPVVVELQPKSVAVTVDLAKAVEATTCVEKAMGETADNSVAAEGVVALSIVVNGAQDITVSAAIKEAMQIEVIRSDGQELSYGSAAKSPLFSLHAQGLKKQLTVDFDLGVTTVSMPWEIFASGSKAAGKLEIDLKGLSASMALDDSISALELTNLGLGDGQSTVKLAGQTILAIDLNKTAGRRFNLSIAPDDPTPPLFSFDPLFDLVLAFDFQPLAKAGDDVPEFLLDETFRILFDGKDPTAQPVEENYETGAAGGIKVLSGKLTISSDKAANPIVVTAGQCLVPSEVTAGEHPVLGSFAAESCQ